MGDPELEGYFQGVHAGMDSRSNFQGAGAVPKNYHVDPHAGRQGAEDRLDQRPLPRHMDMDVGLLGNMVWGRRGKGGGGWALIRDDALMRTTLVR